MVMHPAIKLRHIRVFLDIASEGALAAVARKQGVTQPALSRSLAELEALLGVPLFLRQGRRLVLSDAGILFRRHAAEGVQALEMAAWSLNPGGAGGRLRVGVLPTVAARFLPQVAVKFQAARPEVVLAVETGPHHHLLRLLREGSIDLMVGRMPVAGEMADLSFDHLYEEEIALIARAGHPGIGEAVPDLLRRVPLILPPETALIRASVDAYLAAIGLVGHRPAFETASLALGRGILLQSEAVWFISRGVVEEELNRGDLVSLPTGARFLSGAVGLTRLQRGRSDAVLTLFTQMARDLAP